MWKLTQVLLLMFGLAVQQPGWVMLAGQGMPSECFSGGVHPHPPNEKFCEQHNPMEEHDCKCKRMTAENDPLCEGEPDVRECELWCYAKGHFVKDESKRVDPICGVRGSWHSSHCRCPIMCHTGTMPPTPTKGRGK